MGAQESSLKSIINQSQDEYNDFYDTDKTLKRARKLEQELLHIYSGLTPEQIKIEDIELSPYCSLHTI